MAEIILYDSIYDWTAADFIKELETLKGQDVSVRVNTPGGDPYAVYGMIAKMNEMPKPVTIKVDGEAASCGAFMLCGKNSINESLDVSTFLFHRAAFPSYIENDSKKMESVKPVLIEQNQFLRGLLESKIPESKFKKLKGVSYDQLFSLETRIDVKLNASEAKQLGLISKIVSLTASAKQEIEARTLRLAASKNKLVVIEQNSDSMSITLAELKASNADVLAEYEAEIKAKIKAEIKSEVATKERERILAFNKLKDGASEALVAKIDGYITDGTKYSAEVTTEILKAQIDELKAAGKHPLPVNENTPLVAAATPGAPLTAEQQSEANNKATLDEWKRMYGRK